MKKRHIAALGFVLTGGVLQIYGAIKGEDTTVNGFAAFLYILGIAVEIIGYAAGHDDRSKKSDS
jgi:hypothetical protein